MEARITERHFVNTIEYLADVMDESSTWQTSLQLRYVYRISNTETCFYVLSGGSFDTIVDLTEMDEGELFQQSLVLDYSLDVQTLQKLQIKLKESFNKNNEYILMHGNCRTSTGNISI